MADRKRQQAVADRIEIKRRFDDVAKDLTGEDFQEDEVTDGMIRSLCQRIGDRKEVMEWVKDITDQWFDAETSFH